MPLTVEWLIQTRNSLRDDPDSVLKIDLPSGREAHVRQARETMGQIVLSVEEPALSDYDLGYLRILLGGLLRGLGVNHTEMQLWPTKEERDHFIRWFVKPGGGQ
jgi:hypothetical protein